MEGVPNNIKNPEYIEHSPEAKAKRVVSGALPLKSEDGETKTGVSVAVGADMVLETGKAYRVISDGSFYMKLGNAGVTATVVDAYIPADTAVNIIMKEYSILSTVAGPEAGTFIQAVEIT